MAIDPHRDRAQMLKVESVQQAWQQWLNKLPPKRREDDDVQEIRWMIEELRVSFFAQQLGTPYPISDKRTAGDGADYGLGRRFPRWRRLPGKGIGQRSPTPGKPIPAFAAHGLQGRDRQSRVAAHHLDKRSDALHPLVALSGSSLRHRAPRYRP
jgi:hypothetical protein